MAWEGKQKVSPSNHFIVTCWGHNILKSAVPYAKTEKELVGKKDKVGRRQISHQIVTRSTPA